jgi:bifunctional enzyme CysN/CysC
MPSGILRFLTCGSVDDGKSTLIGRLLHDTKVILDDQMAALKQDSGGGDTPDYSLLLDGLQAEREQGITIDVAYRHFTTDRRRFIVADTPGHIQYTRNMATGASTSELAVILVDARKGVLTQTLRHSYISALFGIRHVILAVNKMDLVDFAEETFWKISDDYKQAVETLRFADITCIPISALNGDNLLHNSDQMPWHQGPSLLMQLEAVDTMGDHKSAPFRLPVQRINRADGEFRGYSGTIASGKIHTGDEITVSPSLKHSRIARILGTDGDLDAAEAGDVVTVTLTDEVDTGRGDIIGGADQPAQVSDQLRVRLLWMDTEPMLPGRTYEIKIGTRSTSAAVSDLRYAVNVDTMDHVAAQTLTLNDIGVCNLSLDTAVAFDPYEENRETGSFILIDRYTKHTVAAGTVAFGLRRAINIVYQALDIDKAARSQIKNQRPCVLWFTGLSGSGKSTVANRLESELHALGHHTQILDGDNVRHGLNRDLGFTDADRVENIRRVSEVSKLFVEAGLIVLVSFISPFRSEREMARKQLEDGEFVEIFVDTPIALCEKRDPKGLYQKARMGKIANFTGIDSPYEPPLQPDIRLETADLSIDAAASEIIAYLRDQGLI